MIDEDDWHEIGLHEDLYVGTTAEKHEATFRYGRQHQEERPDFVCPRHG